MSRPAEVVGEITPGNTERIYTDEPIPGREEGEVE